MNCPVRTDPFPDEGHNQNPPELAPELTTRKSLNTPRGTIGSTRIDLIDGSHDPADEAAVSPDDGEHGSSEVRQRGGGLANPEPGKGQRERKKSVSTGIGSNMLHRTLSGRDRPPPPHDEPGNGLVKGWFVKVKHVLVKYTKFIGPGFMVSVAYIDPGNYATDVAAGATFRYRLLFMVLLSNIFAIFLQSLCIKLGTVTGMNLAENCKAHLPWWLNYILYFFAEAAIIATDIAEVIGTAIALNILLKIPLVAGCAISIVDVLVILFFYNPTGMSMRALRTFEIFVILLVLGVVICFCYELSKIENTTVGEVFKGYLPSSAVVQSQGLYQSCGILGATVMPHSLYLGSGIVQNRLRDFDERNNGLEPLPKAKLFAFNDDNESTFSIKYKPSLSAIRSCLNYSIIELAASLFTFALFVNSAILITAGASLSHLPKEETDDADLFTIHRLLADSIAPVAGTMFALALLLSGTSAGIVCTIAGQMVSEGQLSWTMKPWVRRLLTRLISITPSIIIAGAVGRKGLSAALEGSQVALSVILPFVSAPLIYFTWSAKVMSVSVHRQDDYHHDNNENPAHEISVAPTAVPDTTENNKEAVPAASAVADVPRPSLSAEEAAERESIVVMKNGWIVSGIALAIWGLITVMNVALLVLLGLGNE